MFSSSGLYPPGWIRELNFWGQRAENVVVLGPLKNIESPDCLDRSFFPKARESSGNEMVKEVFSVDSPGPRVQDTLEVGKTKNKQLL